MLSLGLKQLEKEKELAKPVCTRKASVSLTIALKSLLWEKESQNSSLEKEIV